MVYFGSPATVAPSTDTLKAAGAALSSRVVLPTRVASVKTGLDALSAYVLLRRAFSGESFLLESADGTDANARFSFIGVRPLARFVARGSRCEETGLGGSRVYDDANPLDALGRLIARFDAGTVQSLPFAGGFVGYVGYNAARYFEKIPAHRKDGDAMDDAPDVHFILPALVVAFDRFESKVAVLGFGPVAEFETVCQLLSSTPASAVALPTVRLTGGIQSDMGAEYERTVEKCQEHIRAGDVFEIVPSRAKHVRFEGDAFAFYTRLRRVSPAPYLFYLDFDGVTVGAASPETLVRVQNGTVLTRPIGGTRTRNADPQADERLALELVLDEKERAEHLMLVDVHRNDLYRVCVAESVKVTELMRVHKFSHVQHLVSTVQGTLAPGETALSALSACFPAATLVGAPKVRAMELLAKFEPRDRALYGGVAGYVAFDGNADFAITIRSFFAKDNILRLQAGAGIVYDSVPSRELAETEEKMEALLRAVTPLSAPSVTRP